MQMDLPRTTVAGPKDLKAIGDTRYGRRNFDTTLMLKPNFMN
jgi:hypothetical protein